MRHTVSGIQNLHNDFHHLRTCVPLVADGRATHATFSNFVMLPSEANAKYISDISESVLSDIFAGSHTQRVKVWMQIG